MDLLLLLLSAGCRLVAFDLCCLRLVFCLPTKKYKQCPGNFLFPQCWRRRYANLTKAAKGSQQQPFLISFVQYKHTHTDTSTRTRTRTLVAVVAVTFRKKQFHGIAFKHGASHRQRQWQQQGWPPFWLAAHALSQSRPVFDFDYTHTHTYVNIKLHTHTHTHCLLWQPPVCLFERITNLPFIWSVLAIIKKKDLPLGHIS